MYLANGGHRPKRTGLRITTEHTECTEAKTLGFIVDLGDLLRNTKFNAETAEAAEKNPSKLCDLCVLCVQTS